MDLEQFKTAWRERPPDSRLAEPREDVMITLRTRLRAFNRDIVWRDWRETAAALFVAVFFGYAAAAGSSPLERTGARIVVIGAVLIPIIMHWTRKQRGRAPAELSVREYCEHELARIDDQIQLLRTVGWWYLAPLFGGGVLHAAGRDQPTASFAVQVSVLTLVCVVVYFGNRRVVRMDLEPMRNDLARQLAELRGSQE